MSINRDQDRDRSSTRDILSGKSQPHDGKVNWLGHKIGSAAERIDSMLLTGATRDQLASTRESFQEHLYHLREEHGLIIVDTGETLAFDRVALQCSPSTGERHS